MNSSRGTAVPSYASLANSFFSNLYPVIIKINSTTPFIHLKNISKLTLKSVEKSTSYSDQVRTILLDSRSVMVLEHSYIHPLINYAVFQPQ